MQEYKQITDDLGCFDMGNGIVELIKTKYNGQEVSIIVSKESLLKVLAELA